MSCKTSNVVPLHIVVCATQSNGIGRAGTLPWKLRTDMKFFKAVTTAVTPPLSPATHDQQTSVGGAQRMNVVMMGRKTWESIPGRFRPLKERINVVISRKHVHHPALLGIEPNDKTTFLAESISSGLSLLGSSLQDCVNRIFVIGGSELYRSALEAVPLAPVSSTTAQVQSILLTRIVSENDFEPPLDTFFPAIDHDIFQKLPSGSSLQEILKTGWDERAIDDDVHKFCQSEVDVVEGEFRYRLEVWMRKGSV